MENANNFKRLIAKRKNTPINVAKYGDYLSSFAYKCCFDSATKGYAIGLSGGIDSAVALAILCNSKTRVIGVFIDIESSELDKKDAESLSKIFNFEYKYINLTDIYHKLLDLLDIQNSQGAKANLKSRLRMSCLYAIANANCLLTCGTTNADEKLVGYYTKFGDNACDVSLLCQLTKSQIYFLAQQYHIPVDIISKKPSAGLYEGQTDEKEMGISYDEIDHYLSYGFINQIQDAKITTRFVTNKHKLTAPIKPKRLLKLRNIK